MQRWSKVRLAENATAAKLGGVDARLNAHSLVTFGFYNRLRAAGMDGWTDGHPTDRDREAADVGSVVGFSLTLYQTGGNEQRR